MKLKHWMFAGVLALGGVPMLTGPDAARADHRDYDRFEREVRVADLPHRVRETVDEERHGRRIIELHFVEREGRRFYRMILDLPGGEDKVVRIGVDGRPLGGEIVDDVERSYMRDRVGRERDSWDGWAVDFDVLPHRARRTIDREAGRGRIREIREVYRRGMTFYRAEIIERDRPRLVYVGPDGTYFGERDEVVQAFRDIDIDECPRPVRETFRHEAGRGGVDYVFTSTRHGERFYTGVIRDRGATTYLTVNDDGRVIVDADVRR